MTVKPLVAVVMGSRNDWPLMRAAAALLDIAGVPNERQVVSAHRTPKLLYGYAQEARERGLKYLIAGAGGAAHLPGMLAALTDVPVLGVPVLPDHGHLGGIDAALSISQMPEGVPVAAFGINAAKNAALFAIAVLANEDEALRRWLQSYRAAMTQEVLSVRLPEQE